MALPKWIDDILRNEAVQNLVKLAAITFATWLVTHYQTAQINERVKKSENLIQQTVADNAAAVASVVTSTPPQEVAPIVEEAAAEVEAK